MIEAEEITCQFVPPQDETYLRWGLIYPRNPRFHYLYPSPTVSILTNIANTLAAYPKFYVQVLHLMNKMNLPAPFGQTTPTPPTPSEVQIESSTESEIESDTETVKLRKKMKRKKEVIKERPKKRIKLLEDFQINIPTVAFEPSKVFELDEVSASQRQIQLKIPTAIQLPKNDSVANLKDTSLDDDTPSSVQGGFGVIEPVAKPVSHEETNIDNECTDFISEKELQRGRLPGSETKYINVFKKYVRGDPSCRLYIKNLAKQTTEKDLKYIFGRYIDWTQEVQVNIFDVRVMKEGRMKGQAFVTLPSETVAISALDDSHAFVLNDKPMVVQFARSAKATADPNTEDK